MKKIFLKALPYLIGFIVINFICYKKSTFYDQERKYTSRIESSIKSNAEVIFLGDSHVETIKLLNLNNNIGNLAFGADAINEMYLKTLIMEKFNKNLKFVFIATEPQIFNNDISPNSTFLNNYLLKIEEGKKIYNKSSLNLITEKIPLLNDRYIKFVLNRLYTSFKNTENSEEIEWANLSNEKRIEKASNTGKLDHKSIMSNESNINIYKDIISLCKSNNIKVIGIRFPVTENYLKQCSKEDIEKVNRFIEGLNLDYNLDYSLEITDPVFFHDEDHLNKKGVEKLSEMIYRDTNIKITQ